MNFKWVVLILALHMLAANLGFAETNAPASVEAKTLALTETKANGVTEQKAGAMLPRMADTKTSSAVVSADKNSSDLKITGTSKTEIATIAQPVAPEISASKTQIGSEQPAASASEALATTSPADQCSVVLPQLEAEYGDLDRQSRASDKVSQENYRNYVNSFNQMTTVLFSLADNRREEMEQINEAEASLKDSIQVFNRNKNADTSKQLQDHYMNLTVRLYSSAMDGQKTVDQLKAALAQVEVNRAQYDSIKQQPVDWDKKRLELEGKIISLKIRCRK